MSRRKAGALTATAYFIRCDKNGTVLSDEELRGLNVTNSTIEALVGEVSARISLNAENDGAFSLKSS